MSSLKYNDKERYVDSCGDVLYSVLPRILNVVERALGERVTNIAVSPISRRQLAATSDQTLCTKIEHDCIVIRFHVNTDLVHNTLERGPAADDPAGN